MLASLNIKNPLRISFALNPGLLKEMDVQTEYVVTMWRPKTNFKNANKNRRGFHFVPKGGNLCTLTIQK